MDDHANSFALIPLFAARLLRTGQDGFQVPQVNDDVAALESLHITINQVANLVDVLLVDVAANCVTNFLKQDLLRRLRGDAAEFFHRQRQKEGVAQFNFFTGQLASFFNRQFRCRICYFIDHHFSC